MKTLIAMSGGVDSSVTAALIKEQGYECEGALMILEPSVDNEENRAAAASVCENLSVPFHVIHAEELFCRHVQDYFAESYTRAETPNPCIICNRKLKFGFLLEEATRLGCDKIATGHYARISYNPETGRFEMRRALDLSKDQSYVLAILTQEQLSRTLLPLGELTKTQARALAESKGFVNAHKSDSQDICFIPDGDYASFIEKHLDRTFPTGNFVDENGNVMGCHKGIIHYTLGQRKGLGVSGPHPYYVKEIHPETNEVVLSDESALFRSTCLVRDINWVSISEPVGPIRVQAKLRYRQDPSPAVAVLREDGLLELTFDTPQRAVTPGQGAVLYDDDLVLAGGFIC